VPAGNGQGRREAGGDSCCMLSPLGAGAAERMERTLGAGVGSPKGVKERRARRSGVGRSIVAQGRE